MKIVTHNASFHADDAFAVSSLRLLYPDAEIIRTRDKNIIKTGDFVLDVGEIYDPETNRFDHHQLGGAGERPNGIPYSSVGLVWKKYGLAISGSEDVANKVDQILIQSIDAADNGMDLSTPLVEGAQPYSIQGVIRQYHLTWKEEGDWDVQFAECVEWATKFLKRFIKIIGDVVEGEQIVESAYGLAEDKRVISIDDKYDLGRELVTRVLTSHVEPLYAILYRQDHKNWQVVAIRKNHGSFDLRKPLPESWAAKSDADLESVSGVEGALFCHRKCFMCTANTKEAAIKMAQLALNS